MKYILPLLLLATPVHAFDFGLTGDRQVSFDLGVGASYGAKYMGSDKNKASPWFIARNLLYTDGPVSEETVESGFSFAPSFNYISKRKDSDDDHLDGLDDINYAIEAGIKLRYRVDGASGYAAVRKGFIGHHGIAGEIGADYTFAPQERWLVTVAAEAAYGDDKFNETYFAVSDAESTRSDLDAYSLGGGFNMGSLIGSVRYSINDKTAIMAEARYDHLINDASDSPIVEDKDDVKVRLGIVHRFSFRF